MGQFSVTIYGATGSVLNDIQQEALKKVKQLCKEFGFTAGMLQGVLAKGRNRMPKT